ncbi:MAG: hypothetical protein LBN24_10925, partial [Mediterranea sp.]|nr:hypothetical protein [Mediterranea sp.]
MDEKKEKEYGPYGLPEVEVIGTMPPWMRKQLGALFDQNPGLFRYAMQHAPNEQVRQLYFTVCFNTARQRAAEEFAMTALATAGCISFIAAAPSILSTTVPFLRQGAMMSSYAIRRGNMIAARM